MKEWLLYLVWHYPMTVQVAIMLVLILFYAYLFWEVIYGDFD